ncbi:tRNA wybutosine-synthesizing protein 3 homolog, partial [Coregonus clupeaformis]|uniref:tRNA wybutosine-synthesizing protein 3 homolog n=1 Tax=Coregonus clupeaformis TaxID=59861 RepID=UPI001BE0C6DF
SAPGFLSHTIHVKWEIWCLVWRSHVKFEPIVLHVQCRQLDEAQLLHSVAINSGFRNSGLTVSKKGKIILVCNLVFHVFINYSV